MTRRAGWAKLLNKQLGFVNRNLLLRNIIDTGINGKFYFALKCILSQTKSCIRLNDIYSEFFNVDSGVRQGDSISSSLFSLYINDLTSEINSLNLGVDVGYMIMSILLYADDLILLASNERDLQILLNCLYKWTCKWRVCINESKSNVIHFRKPNKRQSEYKFIIGNRNIQYTDTYKYLGLILDENLNFTPAIEALASSGQRALGSVISKYKCCKYMGFKTYTTFYNSGVAPILEYCSIIWAHKVINKLENVQNRAMRTYLGVNRFSPLHGIYGDMGWSNFESKIIINYFRYWNRLIEMDNERITKIVFHMDYNSNNSHTWCSHIAGLFRKLNLENSYLNKDRVDITVVKNKLVQLEQNKWKEEIRNRPKLRFCCKFKKEKKLEPYISMQLLPRERSYLTQLRLGILPINIETGRAINLYLLRDEFVLCVI